MENNNNMENQGQYSCVDIANYFIKERNNNLTHMKLQKLIYFANGLFLVFNGKPLIKERFSAWKYGPVIEGLFYDLNHYKGDPITTALPSGKSIEDSQVLELLAIVNNVFGKMDTWELSELSHIKEGAWDKADKFKAILKDEDIEYEFNEFHIPALINKK